MNATAPYLSLHPECAGGHQRLASQDTSVVHQVSSGDVVRAVRHDVIHVVVSEVKEGVMLTE